MAQEQERTNINIPQDPEARKKIMKKVQDFSDSKLRAKAETDLQKVLIAEIETEFEIPKDVMKAFANAYHKDKVDEIRLVNQDLVDLADALVPPTE